MQMKTGLRTDDIACFLKAPSKFPPPRIWPYRRSFGTVLHRFKVQEKVIVSDRQPYDPNNASSYPPG